MKSAEEVYLLSLIFLGAKIDSKKIDNPVEFINGHLHEMLTSDAIYYIWENINNVSKNSKVKVDDIIAFLIRDFIKKTTATDNFLIKYLNDSPKEEVYQFFKENPHFAGELIRSYYTNISKKEKEDFTDNLKLIYKFTPVIKVDYITNMLRASFSRVYELINHLGALPVSPAQTFWLLLRGGAAIGGQKEVDTDVELLKSYEALLFRIMYADVYEYLVSSGIINASEKKITQLVNNAISQNKYNAPKDATDFNLLFSYFGYLAGSPEKRDDIRKNLDKESLEVVKKINPLWIIDESGIINKR